MPIIARQDTPPRTTPRPAAPRLWEIPSFLGGALTAVYLLLGRWSFERLQHTDDIAFFDAPTAQVRHYVLVVLVLATVFGVPYRRGKSSFQILRPRWIVPLWLAFLFYLSLAALWSPACVETTVKVLDMASLAVLILCVASWTGSQGRECYQASFWLAFCAIVAVQIALSIAGYGFSDEQRMSSLGGGPNVFGRTMAIGFLGSLYLIRKGLGRYWIVVTILAPIFVLVSGSRGALAAMVCGTFAYFSAERSLLRKRLAAVTAVLLVTGAVLFYSDMGQQALSTYEERIVRLTVQDRYDSERSDLAQTAFEMSLRNPVFGAGLASFPAYTTAFYAHNLFLETLSETGGVGLCLLLTPLIVFVAFSLRHWRLVDRPTFCAFAAAFVHAQFSGDLFDSRAVFVLLIMASSVVAVESGARQPKAGSAAARHRAATGTGLTSVVAASMGRPRGLADAVGER